MKHLHKYFSSFALVLTLTACGGGSSGGGGGGGGGGTVNPPSLVAPSAQSFIEDVAITTLSVTNSGGGELSACTSDTLPDGLTLVVSTDRTGCEISGTPSQLQDPTTHNITATNSAGSSTVGVEISVVVAAPDLQDTAQLSFEQNESISIEFSNLGGGALEQCLASLPSGLSLNVSANAQTCVLSGAVASVQNNLEVDVTASNVSGQSVATAFISITPIAVQLEAPSLQNFAAGELAVDTQASFTLQNTGGGELSQCSSSDLPSGLSVAVTPDATSCVVSGTPTTVQAQTNSNVTATNASGTSQASVSIAVVASVPLLPSPNLADLVPLTLVQQTASSLTLVNNGGGQLSACVASGLPAGLSVSTSSDASTCILSGTPSTVQAASNATITATNDTGSSSVTVSITVEAPPPVAPSLDSVSALTLTQNEGFTQTLTNSGGGELSACTASALPTGLSIAVSGDAQNCILSGTPTDLQAATNVTFTATNETGSSSVSSSIAVIISAPDLTDVSGLSFVQLENFTVEFLNTGGVGLTECSADLPGGLSIARNAGNTSCVVSGFIGVPQDELELIVSASNSAGQTTATLTLTITGDAPFITTWDTAQTTLTNTSELTIYTASGTSYNYSIDWGDGTIDENVMSDVTHTYDTAGVYTVKISGDFPQPCISTNCGGPDAQKIVSIEQWGDQVWTSMAGAFFGSPDFLINDPLAPDLSQVSSMSQMFRSSSFNQDIGHWDVSNVETMEGMFRLNEQFNQDIGAWDVSSVTDMADMFFGASSFNQDIGSWIIDNVQDIFRMFAGATVFNQDIGSWNVSNITDMSFLFVSARAFNQDLSTWDVSNGITMESTFEDARAFNQDLSAWIVSNVENMNRMFAGALVFNQDIDSWTTTSLTETESMFEGALAFNRDISAWNVSNVTSMSSMFEGALAFNQDLAAWNVSNVADMTLMFSDSALSVANYDSLLVAWSMLTLQSNVTLDVSQGYSASSAAFRQSIIDNFTWTINDNGQL